MLHNMVEFVYVVWWVGLMGNIYSMIIWHNKSENSLTSLSVTSEPGVGGGNYLDSKPEIISQVLRRVPKSRDPWI